MCNLKQKGLSLDPGMLPRIGYVFAEPSGKRKYVSLINAGRFLILKTMTVEH